MSSSQPGRSSARNEHDRSLDLVQRVIISALVAVVFGTFAAVLAAYLAIRGDQDLPHFSVVGLWIMSRVLGLGTAASRPHTQPPPPPSGPPPPLDSGLAPSNPRVLSRHGVAVWLGDAKLACHGPRDPPGLL